MLMEKGADPACPDAVGATALHYAVSEGHVQPQNILVITLRATVNLFTLNFLPHLFPSSSPSLSLLQAQKNHVVSNMQLLVMCGISPVICALCDMYDVFLLCDV